MNTHPVVAKLRQEAGNFQNPDHPDYRSMETPLHHAVRSHTIHAAEVSLRPSQAEQTEELSSSQVERLQADLDTFRSTVTDTADMLQRAFRNPVTFRDILHDSAAKVEMSAPRRPRNAAAKPTLAEVTAYLDVRKREILDSDQEADESALIAVDAMKHLADMWKGRRRADPNQDFNMHNSLEDDERRDLARARDSTAKIGEEVLSRIVQWSEKTPDESQASPQERFHSSPHQLSPELRKRLARAAAGNTTIHTSLPNNTAARFLHDPGDGFNTIGDMLPEGEWVLPDEIVDEASWGSGLHLQGATESDMRIGMPELVCFVPKTEQKPKEPAKKRMFGADIPTTYEEVDVTTRNPNTGHEEPVVNFIYSYNPRRIKDIALEQELMHQDPRTGRMGNLLEIAVSLPKSEADDLQKELVKDPVKARPFVEELVKTRGNIAPGEWDGSTTERKLGVRPPVFVDKPDRSPQARQLAAKPRIIVPTTDKAAGRAFSQRVFRLVA